MLKSKRFAIIGGVIIAAVGFIMGGFYLIRQAEEEIIVVVPELSLEALTGMAGFEMYCVECHGKNASGTDKGPSLVTRIYAPLHHGDFSFVRAVTLGVPQHHWLFGGMPALPQVTRQEIDRIIIYIRELQKANGIK